MWEDSEISAAVKGFVLRGGGLIGVGEPSGHQYQGRYLQLAGVLGVEKETGFTLNYDKYNWEEHPGHFILSNCDGAPMRNHRFTAGSAKTTTWRFTPFWKTKNSAW